MITEVTVRVPATTANLGPGFDALGMALEIHNTLQVTVGGSLSFEAEGEGAASIPRGPGNVTYRAIHAVFEKAGREVPPLRLHAKNGIPLARGLGSSAAAVVAGLVAGNALCEDHLSIDELLALGLALEGHPDNVAPALLGGCIAAAVHDGQVIYGRVPVPQDLKLALFIPDFEMPTKEARAILPDPVPRADAVFNLSRVALLVTAFCSNRLDLLGLATEDRLHQPPRQTVFPAMPALFAAARQAGALGVFLSGAGSTVVALCVENADKIGGAMAAAAAGAGISGRPLATRPSLAGATIT